MTHPGSLDNRRILVIDDTQAIHDDFCKILTPNQQPGAELNQAEQALFGETVDSVAPAVQYELTSALQGQAGYELACQAYENHTPFAVAFVDVRMPPGWNGIETVQRIWKVDPNLQVVICTAHSDYSWDQMIRELGAHCGWIVLKKPFDNIEVRQLATALVAKWNLADQQFQHTALLEKTVSERTEQLESQRDDLQDALARLQEAHAQLLQIDKMASIGQLAAGVAHEINNPIGFISSNLNSLAEYTEEVKKILQAYAELLNVCQGSGSGLADQATRVCELKEAIDLDYILADLDSLITESIEGTQRVRKIVADLRDFSHIDTAEVDEEDLNILIDKTINVAWNELKYKAEVVRDYGQIPEIPCYGGKLGQLFLNLLVNAAHAIEEHGTITVRTGQADETVWIEIEDTGCGMPPDIQSRVFEPFFTTKDVGKGTGMGLHLAYRIIEAHHGKISLRSEVGSGTVFRIELPIAGPLEIEEDSSASVF